MSKTGVFRRSSIAVVLALMMSVMFLSVAIAGQPAVKLRVFQVGTIVVPDKGILLAGKGGTGPYPIPVNAYLIEHPKGLAIVDTGLNPATWHPDRAKEVQWKPEEQRVDKQLAKIGYKPEDIKYVVMTHMHLDHAGWMRLFPKSVFVVRNEELRSAWWPEPWIAWTWMMGDYEDTRKFNYIQPGPDEDFDLFSDGSVICFDTKGHTRGHQSVLINLPKTGKVVITGDAGDSYEQIDEGIMPGIVWSPEYALKAIKRFQHMRRNGVTLFPSHDPDFQKTVKLSPAFYD